MDNEILVRNIKDICKARGIATSEIERHFNWSPGLISSRWRSSSPAIDKVAAIAQYLGVTVSYLIGEEEQAELSVVSFLDVLIKTTKQNNIQWIKLSRTSNLLSDDVMNSIYESDDFTNISTYVYKNDEMYYVLLVQWNNKDNGSDKNIDMKLTPVVYGEHPADPYTDENKLLKLLEYIDYELYHKMLVLKRQEYEKQFISYYLPDMKNKSA